ncbi:hypothetical protein P3T37_006485 [Kitasatospora sp. MAA4]|nr:hypothetical protein [Kitasatospora sp. MAA4]
MNGPSIESSSSMTFNTGESPGNGADPTPGEGASGQRRSYGRPRKRARRLGTWVRRRSATGPDSGMSTAEYAVGTLAACGFAALLYKVLTSSAVTDVLTELLNRALHAV